MLTKIKQFVKSHLDDIILLIGVILISLLSFAAGFIVAKQQEKEPLKIEKIIGSPKFAKQIWGNIYEQSSTSFRNNR